MNIDERKPEYRREIIEILEKNGYNLDKNEFRSRENIIEAYLPIVINFDTKEYRMMGNVTCAAAAASGKGLKTKEEFYKYFKEREGGTQMGKFQVEKIYFDMDGVLADFERGVKEICGIEPPPQPQDLSEEERMAKKAADDQMWELIRQAGDFYYRLELMPGAKEMFDALYEKYGDKVEILTGVPKEKRHIDSAGDDKTRWVREKLSKTIKMNIVPREDKIKMSGKKGCILIDDMALNITEWESKGGTGIRNLDAASTMEKLKEMGIL